MGKPTIIVTFNYRLNIFAFGDGGETNLALKDQRTAIDWVVAHIHGFGGDKNNITLAGESAGAVFADAHFALGAPVKRGILHSGSLYLSPPQPLSVGAAFIKSLEQKVHANFHSSLAKVSVDELLSTLCEHDVNRMWLQADEEMADWNKSRNQVSELLIGDCEYEVSVLSS
jgi:carboxylesterase type B